MNLKKVLGLVLASVMMVGLIGCGDATATKTSTDTTNNNEAVSEAAEASDGQAAGEAVETAGTDAVLTAGVYYAEFTEEFDDGELTTINYLLLNEDGTGTFCIQDSVPVTWTENQVVTEYDTLEASIDGDKLTLTGTDSTDELTRFTGKLVRPIVEKIDEENIPDGTYPASLGGFDLEDDVMTANVFLYTEDWYDIVDINTLEVGDAIIVDDIMYVIKDSKFDGNKFVINGGEDVGGIELINPEDSNGYRYFGYDDRSSYTRQLIADLEVDKNTVLKDSFATPGEVKDVSYADLPAAFEENAYFSEYNTTVTIKDNVIVEIVRNYTP